MRRIFRDEQLQESFEKQGYVVVDVLDAEQVAFLAAKAKELMPADPKINDPQNSYYGSYFDIAIRKQVSDFLRAYMAERLAGIVEGYETRFGTYLLKHAGAQPLPPHQHNPYIADFLDTVINVWIPLDHCGEPEGVLQVIPNSHKIHWHLQTCHTDTYFGGLGARLQEKYLVGFDLRPGQAVIFEDSIIHGSAANRSDRDRLAVLTTLIPEDSQPAFYIEAEQPDGPFQIVEAAHEFAHADMGMEMLPPRNEWRIVGELPNRNSPVTEEELDWLLQSGRKIGPASHPLEDLRARRANQAESGEAKAGAAARGISGRTSLPNRALGKLRRFIGRLG